MTSDEREFWDRRYSREGAIWGDGPSPTALLLAGCLPPRARVLEVGFGYGRDLLFLLRNGCRVAGIELSGEGRRSGPDPRSGPRNRKAVAAFDRRPGIPQS